MRHFACLLALAGLPFATAEDDTRLTEVRGLVSARAVDDGEVVVELHRSASLPGVEVSPRATKENRQLVRAAKASPGPFEVVAKCRLLISLGGQPSTEVVELVTPKAPEELEVELHAEGFKLADGRVMPGCGPLAKLLTDLQAPGAKATLKAQELTVDGAPVLHVTGVKTYPIPHAFQWRLNSSQLAPLPLRKPLWIHAEPQPRRLAGGDPVLSVRSGGRGGMLTLYVRITDLAIEAPTEGEACARLGFCEPTEKEPRQGAADALEQR